MNMENRTSECKSAATVDAIQAVTIEVREARRKLLRQIIRTMNLVNCRMLEAKDFKELKEQNVQRRLKAVKAQVKTSRYSDLGRFRQHIREEISQLHAQISMGWDLQAMHEGCQQVMTRCRKGPSRMQYTAGGTSWAWKSPPDTS